MDFEERFNLFMAKDVILGMKEHYLYGLTL
jgi:hypothetical protein